LGEGKLTFDKSSYMKKYLPEWRKKNREKVRVYWVEYRHKNNDQVHQYEKNMRLRRKIEVLSHYSGNTIPQCANPFGEHSEPYVTLDALTIDHINGGGNKERKRLFGRDKKSGYSFYAWLKRNKFPSGYQVLCMNCQTIKKLRTGK